MLRDEDAWVDYVLSSAGILFAGSVLLLAICGVFRLTLPGNEQILLQSTASEVVNQIEEVDLKSFPCKHSFRLGDDVDVAISCEHISVSGSSNAVYARALMTCVYPSKNSFWNNTSDMRLFLEKEFGSDGMPEHGITPSCASNLSGIFNAISLSSSLDPVHLNEQILLEKEFIYFDNGVRRGYVFVSGE